MKIKAYIEWIIDDKALNIKSGTTEAVEVDTDYVESNELDIIEWVENEIEKKYGTFLQVSRDPYDDGDFVIKNMSNLIEDLSYEEFLDKTDDPSLW